MTAFCDITPCSLGIDRRFRVAYCLHYQGNNGGEVYDYVSAGQEIILTIASSIQADICSGHAIKNILQPQQLAVAERYLPLACTSEVCRYWLNGIRKIGREEAGSSGRAF
jgi:hypothetical protein